MKRSRLVVSIVMALAILGSAAASLLLLTDAGAQSTGEFAVTSVMRSCTSNELVVNVENTTGQSWSLEVLFSNSSDSTSYQVDAGNQGMRSSAVVPHSGDPFDYVMLTVLLNDGWRFSYEAFVGLCGESFEAYYQNSWAPIPQVDISITNASCVSFDWFVSSTHSVRLEIGVARPAAAGEFPMEVVDIGGGETSGTFVSGVEWPTMLVYVRAYSEVSPGEFEMQVNEMILIEDCAAVAPTVPPTVPAETPVPTEPSDGTTVTIVVTMPDGSSIEGAPWALYAPMASMQQGGAYATGVVGPNNTIVIVGLPDGDYVLVISPEGREPITLEIAVAGGADGTQVIPVDLAAPTETPQVTDPAGTQTPAVTKPGASQAPGASASAGKSPVSALPNTGSGDVATGSRLLAAAIVAVVVSATGAVSSRGLGRR